MTTESSRRIRSVTWLRTIASGLFGILAVLGLVASLVAVWATNVLYSKDSIAGVVDAALREPEVTDGLATLLTDELLKAVDLQTVLSDQLPDPLDPVVPAIVGGVRSFVKDTFEDVLTSSTTRNTLVTLVEVSHTALVRLLDGDGLGDGFTVTDDEVSVNLLPLLGLGVSALQQNGLLTNLEMPELAVSGNPVDQIAALERATGRDLPESFGQLVLFLAMPSPTAPVSCRPRSTPWCWCDGRLPRRWCSPCCRPLRPSRWPVSDAEPRCSCCWPPRS